jgi:hypothetical protein
MTLTKDKQWVGSVAVPLKRNLAEEGTAHWQRRCAVNRAMQTWLVRWPTATQSA